MNAAPTPESRTSSPAWLAVSLLLVGVYLAVLLRTAWMCDDAYIMLRTCHNLSSGYGPVFNVGERVESYSNPLWMLLVAAFYAVTREPYFTTLALSVVVSLGAAVVVCRTFAGRVFPTALALTVLILSKAYVDYSTSGLENALSHLLLALFLRTYLSGSGTLTRLSLLAALAATNRFDALLFYVFPLGFAFRADPAPGKVRRVLHGLAPLLAWKVFALFYYGFPFPNTAYSKVLATGASVGHRLELGRRYLGDSLEHDPVTLSAVGGAVVLTLFLDRRRGLPLVAGLLAHLAYLVWIGGDYMSGRFLSPLVLVSAVLLGRSAGAASPLLRAVVYVAVLSIGLATPKSPLRSGPGYRGEIDRGIADVRGLVFHRTGLISPTRSITPLPVRDEVGPLQVRQGGIGFHYYEAGPGVHAIDLIGLTDPLLSRLPGVSERRAGHTRRSLPDGYAISLQSGENRIEHPGLRAYYDDLRLVTRGGLLDWRRVPVIWSLNLGRSSRRLAEFAAGPYREPKTVDAAAVPEHCEVGTPWYGEGVVLFGDPGLVVRFPEPVAAEALELTLDRDDKHKVTFLDLGSGAVVGQRLVGPRHLVEEGGAGLSRFLLDVPRAAARAGFDAVRIEAGGTDGIFALGHLTRR